MDESYANLIVSRQGRVGVAQLNRPQALNALNGALMDELVRALASLRRRRRRGLHRRHRQREGLCRRRRHQADGRRRRR
jgi:enoyl-CoA hydratase/carnithine racemase